MSPAHRQNIRRISRSAPQVSCGQRDLIVVLAPRIEFALNRHARTAGSVAEAFAQTRAGRENDCHAIRTFNVGFQNCFLLIAGIGIAENWDQRTAHRTAIEHVSGKDALGTAQAFNGRSSGAARRIRERQIGQASAGITRRIHRQLRPRARKEPSGHVVRAISFVQQVIGDPFGFIGVVRRSIEDRRSRGPAFTLAGSPPSPVEALMVVTPK